MRRRLGVAAAVVDGALVPGDVAIDDGTVVAVACAPAGTRGIAVPGLVDVHVHGGVGVDLLTADAAGYARVERHLLAAGVTAFQPTFATASLPRLHAALATVGDRASRTAVRILGAHLEGPFLAPTRLGAHPPDLRLDPDAAVLEALLAAGPVSEVTLAPELPGALALVELLVARGVVVSLGHADATAAQARAAVARGARAVTHVFNAMRPLHHREPGIAGVALVDPHVFVELIVDGHHVHPDVVALVWKVAAGRVVLVSDGTAAAGTTDSRAAAGTTAGTAPFGDVEVAVVDGAVRTHEGALAGSAITMIDAVRTLHGAGVELALAVDAASRAPARLLRRIDVGHLDVGAPADVVILDDRLDVRETLVAGRTHHAA